MVGTGLVDGKAALRDYWARALERQPDLKFTVERVYAGHGMAVIAYTNHRGVHAAETLMFDADGMVYEASASHAD